MRKRTAFPAFKPSSNLCRVDRCLILSGNSIPRKQCGVVDASRECTQYIEQGILTLRYFNANVLSERDSDEFAAPSYMHSRRRTGGLQDVLYRNKSALFTEPQRVTERYHYRRYPRSLREFKLPIRLLSLAFNRIKSAQGGPNATMTYYDQEAREDSHSTCYTQRPSINGFLIIFLVTFLVGLILVFGPIDHFNNHWGFRCATNIGFGVCGLSLLFWFMAGFVFPYTWGLPPQWIPAQWNPCPQKDYQRIPHGETVSQQLLTLGVFSYYDKYMANVLPTEKQITIIGSLCEGSSIRSIERLTGVHRDTIMRLGVKVGQGCTALMDASMHNLSCERLEMDEIWGFVGKKQKHVSVEDSERTGDVWTFCAIDADTKLVPAFKVGKRDSATANAFVDDVAGRMRNRVQISTDGLKAYVSAIDGAFGADVDYAQIIKTYGDQYVINNRRYSAPEFVASEKRTVIGWPDVELISTSYVERLNATTRLHMRRLTRLTLAFSKKWENFESAVGLHFAYYNFVKRHSTVRATPAMAAGVTNHQWRVSDLVEASA